MRWTRRRFLGSSVATVCVGCSADDDAEMAVSAPSTSTPQTPTAAEGEVTVSLPPGGPVLVGSFEALRGATSPVYVPEARAWLVSLTEVEAAAVASAADDSLLPGLKHGLLALHEKCPHLGCRVPFCETSGWFECACHGSMFTRAGEHRGGPGPRGLDAFPVEVAGDDVLVNPRRAVSGALAGTIVLELPAKGPHCVGTIER